jgi:uncharacterized protein (DUF58 family)
MLLAVALGRGLALVAVTRLRAAGFEMVWAERSRVKRVSRGGQLVLKAELRNRGAQTVRGTTLRPLASSMLEVSVEPKTVDIPGESRVRIDVVVQARRVGRWGIHGMALEVRGVPFGGEGLFEVPLLFANPLGVEVFPPTLEALILSPRGGRARKGSELGRPRNVAGDGDELRELRDHVPGDPFKRIAWKASARRGRLLVREMEQEERENVWLVLDASVELWSGELGCAPLDREIDDLAAHARRHLLRGDRVGLVVYASRLRAWIQPDEGAAHASLLAAALASASNMVDADRSELDEVGVARRVSEHARPLDSRALADLPRGDLDALARRADLLRARAPFAPRVPFAHTPREQALRQYLAAFGIESPPRVEGERERAEATLRKVLEGLGAETPRASVVHLWAAPPATPAAMTKCIGSLRRRRIEVRWSLPALEAGLGGDRERRSGVADVADEFVRLRARATLVRAERVLRRLGVRVVMRGAVRKAPFATPAEPHEGVQ